MIVSNFYQNVFKCLIYESLLTSNVLLCSCLISLVKKLVSFVFYRPV